MDANAGIEWGRFEGAVGFAGSINGERVIGSVEWRSLEAAPGSDRVELDSAVFVQGPHEGGDTRPVDVAVEFAARLAAGDLAARRAFLAMVRDSHPSFAVENPAIREPHKISPPRIIARDSARR